MRIEFIHTTTGYSKVPMIKDLNLVIEAGESTCVLGANGIGKTTLFKTLLGLIDIVEGDILIDGTSIKKMSSKEIATALSYVPQAKNYSYQYTVLDIVLMGRAMYIDKFSEPSRADIDVAKEALRKLGMEEYCMRMYSELSGGEQQVVLVARALAQDASFIVMDEPASNLDFGNQRRLIDVIKMLRDSGKGVLMASHSPDHAFACCSNAILVFQDRTVMYGPTKEILTETYLRKVYGVDVNIISGIDSEGKQIQSCILS